MTPEMLVEKMEEVYRSQPTRDGYYCGYPIAVCKDILRIVLQAIEDGEVVEMCDKCDGIGSYMQPTCCDYEPIPCDKCNQALVVLNPSFSKFLEGAK